jgi:hypothetical protein
VLETFSFTETAATGGGVCGTQTCTFKNAITADQAKTDAVFTLASPLITGTPTERAFWPGTHTFYVQCVYNSFPDITQVSNNLVLTITDPCLTTTIDTTQTIDLLQVG